MTGIIRGVVTSKDKAKSNPLANQKVMSITKSMVSFKSFLIVSLRGAFAPKELKKQKRGTITNRCKKSAS